MHYMLFPKRSFQLCVNLLTHITKPYKHRQVIMEGVNIISKRYQIMALPYILSHFNMAGI